MMQGFQKKYLRGLAHHLNPVVQIGQHGLTESVIQAIDNALLDHELIKIKFVDFKEKAQKTEIGAEIEEFTGAVLAGMVGHTAIFFRTHPDPAKRKIQVPERTE